MSLFKNYMQIKSIIEENEVLIGSITSISGVIISIFGCCIAWKIYKKQKEEAKLLTIMSSKMSLLLPQLNELRVAAKTVLTTIACGNDISHFNSSKFMELLSNSRIFIDKDLAKIIEEDVCSNLIIKYSSARDEFNHHDKLQGIESQKNRLKYYEIIQEHRRKAKEISEILDEKFASLLLQK